MRWPYGVLEAQLNGLGQPGERGLDRTSIETETFDVPLPARGESPLPLFAPGRPCISLERCKPGMAAASSCVRLLESVA